MYYPKASSLNLSNLLCRFIQIDHPFILNRLSQALALPKQTQITIRQKLQRFITAHRQPHRYGYHYAPMVCNRLLELLVLQWPGGVDSKPHSHGASINFTRVMSGKLLERKYHVSGGQLRVISERIVETGQWAWTLPFEIHDLISLDTPAETLHIYFPGRAC